MARISSVGEITQAYVRQGVTSPTVVQKRLRWRNVLRKVPVTSPILILELFTTRRDKSPTMDTMTIGVVRSVCCWRIMLMWRGGAGDATLSVIDDHVHTSHEI
jgi:hypothetical protein